MKNNKIEESGWYIITNDDTAIMYLEKVNGEYYAGGQRKLCTMKSIIGRKLTDEEVKQLEETNLKIYEANAAYEKARDEFFEFSRSLRNK